LADQLAEQLDFVVQGSSPEPGFILYGRQGAFSRIHCASDGYASRIKIGNGAKFWYVMVKGDEPEGHPTCSLSNWKNWAEADWDMVFLEAGDIM